MDGKKYGIKFGDLWLNPFFKSIPPRIESWDPFAHDSIFSIAGFAWNRCNMGMGLVRKYVTAQRKSRQKSGKERKPPRKYRWFMKSWRRRRSTLLLRFALMNMHRRYMPIVLLLLFACSGTYQLQHKAEATRKERKTRWMLLPPTCTKPNLVDHSSTICCCTIENRAIYTKVLGTTHFSASLTPQPHSLLRPTLNFFRAFYSSPFEWIKRCWWWNATQSFLSPCSPSCRWP